MLVGPGFRTGNECSTQLDRLCTQIQHGRDPGSVHDPTSGDDWDGNPVDQEADESGDTELAVRCRRIEDPAMAARFIALGNYRVDASLYCLLGLFDAGRCRDQHDPSAFQPIYN